MKHMEQEDDDEGLFTAAKPERCTSSNRMIHKKDDTAGDLVEDELPRVSSNQFGPLKVESTSLIKKPQSSYILPSGLAYSPVTPLLQTPEPPQCPVTSTQNFIPTSSPQNSLLHSLKRLIPASEGRSFGAEIVSHGDGSQALKRRKREVDALRAEVMQLKQGRDEAQR